MRSTHTYATLPVPAHLHAFVKKALNDAGYAHAILREEGDEHLDMHGIALTKLSGLDIEVLRMTVLETISDANSAAFKAGYQAGVATQDGDRHYKASAERAWKRWDVPAANAIAVSKAVDNLLKATTV